MRARNRYLPGLFNDTSVAWRLQTKGSLCFPGATAEAFFGVFAGMVISREGIRIWGHGLALDFSSISNDNSLVRDKCHLSRLHTKLRACPGY